MHINFHSHHHQHPRSFNMFIKKCIKCFSIKLIILSIITSIFILILTEIVETEVMFVVCVFFQGYAVNMISSYLDFTFVRMCITSMWTDWHEMTKGWGWSGTVILPLLVTSRRCLTEHQVALPHFIIPLYVVYF